MGSVSTTVNKQFSVLDISTHVLLTLYPFSLSILRKFLHPLNTTCFEGFPKSTSPLPIYRTGLCNNFFYISEVAYCSYFLTFIANLAFVICSVYLRRVPSYLHYALSRIDRMCGSLLHSPFLVTSYCSPLTFLPFPSHG